MTDTKIQIRITGEEKERWKGLAEGLGMTLTDFIKMKVNDGVMTEEEELGEDVMTGEKEFKTYFKK
jgi:antitoxin component of RelBE/YafQ-DinJ toxin-antitoxin module